MISFRVLATDLIASTALRSVRHLSIVTYPAFIRPMLVSAVYHPYMNDSLPPQIEELMPLLAAFDTAAHLGHVTKAAELLGVPQSSLSRRLRAVERTVGLPLFQPAGRQIALTPQGRDLFQRTHSLVAALDEAVRAVRGNADPDSGFVRFGFPLSLGPISIPSVLAKFHASAPRIRLTLVQAHGQALTDQMRSGELDLAIMIPAPIDYPAVVLGHQRLGLYVAKSHPLATSNSVDLAELRDETFIANPKSFHLRKVFDSWCEESGFTPRVPFEIAEFDTLRGMVAHGLGVALLPDAEIDRSDLALINVSGPRHRSIALAWAERGSRAAFRLRDHIIAEAASIVDDVEPLHGLV